MGLFCDEANCVNRLSAILLSISSGSRYVRCRSCHSPGLPLHFQGSERLSFEECDHSEMNELCMYAFRVINDQ